MIVVGMAALTSAAVVAQMTGRGASDVTQPLAFNHKRHIEEGMSCLDCHKGADQRAEAGFPPIRSCLLCHSEAKGTHPDEPKIREFAERKESIPWIRVNRMPGHVYFSHAAHVAYAKMDCRECHGEMKDRTEPVTRSQVDHLNMNRCMACHDSKGVSTDCLRCHK